MADKQLGAKLKALLFSLLNAYKIILVFTLILNYVNANSTCTDTQVTIDLGDGTFQCEDCSKCAPGYGISHKCGDVIDGEARYICKPCLTGESYSDKDDLLQCKKCDSCMESEDVVHPCDERTNVQCGKSCVDPNRYFDDERGCLNCSCCGDSNHTVVEECKRKLGPGSNMICSFNSSATGCEFTPPLPKAETTRSHVVTTRLLNQNMSDFITPSPQTETTRSHVVTTRLPNQSSSDFITASLETETSSSHVVTTCLFNHSISNCDSTTPLPQNETTSSPDAMSTPVTSNIHSSEAINDPYIFAAIIVPPVVCFLAILTVAVLLFLHLRKMRRYCVCGRNRAMNGDLEMQPYPGQNPEERPPVEPRATVAEEGVETATTGHQGDSEVNFEEKEENGGGQGEEEEPLLVELENLCANRQKQDSTSKEYGAEEGVRTTAPTDQQDEVKVEGEKKDDDNKEEGAAAAADKQEEEEEEDRKPLLEKEEPVQSTSVDCPQQDRKNKDSKHLESLLDKIDTLDEICYCLDTPVPGRGNYRVVAEHYGFTHYKIKSVLEKSDGGPSRALIENIVAGDPDLTVEEFATVVEEKAKRKDVSNLLRAYDSPEVIV